MREHKEETLRAPILSLSPPNQPHGALGAVLPVGLQQPPSSALQCLSLWRGGEGRKLNYNTAFDFHNAFSSLLMFTTIHSFKSAGMKGPFPEEGGES